MIDLKVQALERIADSLEEQTKICREVLACWHRNIELAEADAVIARRNAEITEAHYKAWEQQQQKLSEWDAKRAAQPQKETGDGGAAQHEAEGEGHGRA